MKAHTGPAYDHSMEKDENGARCRRYGQDGGDVSEGGQGMTVYRPSFPRVMESGTSSQSVSRPPRGVRDTVKRAMPPLVQVCSGCALT